MYKRGELQVIASDEDGPILQVARVNGVPWFYFDCLSTDIAKVGKATNLVFRCKNNQGDWVETIIQAGLCGDEAGNEQGDIDVSIKVNGQSEVVGWAGVQGPGTGPGLVLGKSNFWNLGNIGAFFKKVFTV